MTTDLTVISSPSYMPMALIAQQQNAVVQASKALKEKTTAQMQLVTAEAKGLLTQNEQLQKALVASQQNYETRLATHALQLQEAQTALMNPAVSMGTIKRALEATPEAKELVANKEKLKWHNCDISILEREIKLLEFENSIRTCIIDHLETMDLPKNRRTDPIVEQALVIEKTYTPYKSPSLSCTLFHLVFEKKLDNKPDMHCYYTSIFGYYYATINDRFDRIRDEHFNYQVNYQEKNSQDRLNTLKTMQQDVAKTILSFRETIGRQKELNQAVKKSQDQYVALLKRMQTSFLEAAQMLGKEITIVEGSKHD